MQRTLYSVLILILTAGMLSAGTKIKFATLAPDGSTWMNVMNEFSKAVKDTTAGEVEFRIYPGGVAGDELNVLRKIRVGQLHSGGFTGVGLGEILPEVRVLDSPFLFRSKDEVDHISAQLFDYFAGKFEEKGFVLLGWAEVGFVYTFTNTPVRDIADMKGVKMWMWEGDPIAEATFRSFGISPIPLSISDVLTSLQTNLIDGIYVSPLACVALQWHTKVSYMLDLPLANSNGAVLLDKRQFDKLSPENQTKLRELSRQYFGKLTQLSREDNAKSLELIRESGITFTEITDKSQIEAFYESGRQARRSLIGRLYDKQLLDRVENSLAEFRQAKNAGGK
jgi:TRAP-type C4-dicarboxylate transport system substrate-binding protein